MGACLSPPSHYLLFCPGFPSPSVSPCHQSSSVYLPRSGDFAFRHVPSHSASHYKACCRMGIFNFKSCHAENCMPAMPAMQTILAVPQKNKKLLTPNLRHTLWLSPVALPLLGIALSFCLFCLSPERHSVTPMEMRARSGDDSGRESGPVDNVVSHKFSLLASKLIHRIS